MSFISQARADWRAWTAAALIGSGLGLGLGAVYMAVGLGAAAAEHAAAQALQRATVRVAISEAAMEPAAAPTPISSPVATARADARMSTQLRSRALPKARANDLECLTAAVYYEARGESASGQQAVAQVVLNRVRHPAFPKSVCGVVYQGAGGRGCQFSFACNGAQSASREPGAWRRARRVAINALAGAQISQVGAATHFHTTGVSPQWGPRMFRIGQVGLHVFYRLVPGRMQAPAERPRAVFASFAPPSLDKDAVAAPEPDLRLSVAMLDGLTEAPAAHASAEAAPAPAPETPAAAPTPADAAMAAEAPVTAPATPAS